METKGLGAGSYPDAPKDIEMKTVKLQCRFITYVSVPEDIEDYEEILNYIHETHTDYDILKEADVIEIEDII